MERSWKKLASLSCKLLSGSPLEPTLKPTAAPFTVGKVAKLPFCVVPRRSDRMGESIYKTYDLCSRTKRTHYIQKLNIRNIPK